MWWSEKGAGGSARNNETQENQECAVPRPALFGGAWPINSPWPNHRCPIQSQSCHSVLVESVLFESNRDSRPRAF